jgi:hypothetical protein
VLDDPRRGGREHGDEEVEDRIRSHAEATQGRQAHGPDLTRSIGRDEAEDGVQAARALVRFTRQSWKRWAFAAVPAVGLLELAAHAVQVSSVVPEKDPEAARDYGASRARSRCRA